MGIIIDTCRRITQIRAQIVEFDHLLRELEVSTKTEENRAGIRRPAHYAYPATARAMTERSDNVRRSLVALRGELARAEAALLRLVAEPNELKKKDGSPQACGE
jgi:hypothetical protein